MGMTVMRWFLKEWKTKSKAIKKPMVSAAGAIGFYVSFFRRSHLVNQIFNNLLFDIDVEAQQADKGECF